MCRAKECLSIWGEMAMGVRFALFSLPVAARTAATRALAASNTFSHDSYAIGIPDSASHSHKRLQPVLALGEQPHPLIRADRAQRHVRRPAVLVPPGKLGPGAVADPG